MAIEEDKGGVILVKETKEYQTKKAISKNKKHGDKKGKDKGRTKDGKRKHKTKKRRSADKKGQDLQQRPSANNRSSKTNLKVEKKNDAGQTPAKERGVPNDEVEKKHEADKRRPLGQNPQRSDNILMENSKQAEKVNQMKPIRSDGNKVQQRSKPMEQRSKQMEQWSKQMEQRSKPGTRNPKKRTVPKPATKQHRKARNTKGGKKKSAGRVPKVITPDVDSQMKPVMEEENDEMKQDRNQPEFQLSVEDVKQKENKATPSKEDPKESRGFSKEQADAIQATTPDAPKSQNELTLQTTQPSSFGRRNIPPPQPQVEAGQEPPLGPLSTMPPMSKTQNGEVTKSDDAKTPRQQQQLPSVPSKPQVFQVTSKTMTKSEQANFLATWHVQPNVAKIGSKTSLNKISQNAESQDRISWVKTEDLQELRMRQQSLVVNVDEVLRLGSVMERQGMTKARRGAFDWIAMNRTTAHQHATAFSSQLMTALGDVELEKGLAIKSIDELRAAGTITGPEYLTLKKTIELLIPPVTVGQIAYLVHTEGAYYKQKTK